MNNFGKGIPLTMGFDLNAPLPLDYKSVVVTIDELKNLSENNLVCYGQTTYVEDLKTFYQYTGEGEDGGWVELCSLGRLKDTISITKDELTLKMDNLEEGLRSKISVTAKELRSEFSSVTGGDFSSLIQDMNGIRTEVSALEGKLNSKITQTAEALRLEMTNKDDELKSVITATAKELRSEFSSIAGGDFSTIYQDIEGLHAEIEAMNGTLNNRIDVTAQGLKADISNLELGLKSEIELSAKKLETKFSEIAGGDYSSIYQDLSTIRTEITGLDGKLTSSITQTADTIRTEMSDMEAGLESQIELTAKNLESKFSEIAGGDYSVLYQDMETIRAEVADVDERLTSSITQTASSIRSEVTDFKSMTESKFTQMSNLIASEVSDLETGLTSKIEQTASSIGTSISDLSGKYTSLKQDVDGFKAEAGDGDALNSKIDQTAAAIRTEVSNLQTNLTSKIEQTSNALTLKFNEGYKQGITTIDKNGISVSHTGMSGYTSMGSTGFYVNNGTEDVISITSNGATFKGKVTVTGGSIPASTLTGTINTSSLNSSIGNAVARVEEWATDAISGSTTIDGGYLQTGTVSANKIAANAISTDKLAANAVTAAKISAGTITATQLAANAITTDKLNANAVTAAKIASNAITTDKLSANAVTAAKIAAGAITADKIEANAITSAKIAADAINGKKIAGGTITGTTINNGSGTFSVSSAGALTATNATIKGKIEATSGSFTGSISGSSISGGTVSGTAISGGTININNQFDVNSSGRLTTSSAIYANGGIRTKGDFIGEGYGATIVTNSTNGMHVYVKSTTGGVKLQPGPGEEVHCGRYGSTTEYSDFRAARIVAYGGLSDDGAEQQSLWAQYRIRGSKDAAFAGKVYSAGTALTSDRTLKENINYISNANTVNDKEISLTDCYDFVKNLALATYNYIEDKNNNLKLGFIAQDLLCNEDQTDNKVGQMVLEELEGMNFNEDKKLTYDVNNVLGVILATLQVIINKIENK